MLRVGSTFLELHSKTAFSQITEEDGGLFENVNIYWKKKQTEYFHVIQTFRSSEIPNCIQASAATVKIWALKRTGSNCSFFAVVDNNRFFIFGWTFHPNNIRSCLLILFKGTTSRVSTSPWDWLLAKPASCPFYSQCVYMHSLVLQP